MRNESGGLWFHRHSGGLWCSGEDVAGIAFRDQRPSADRFDGICYSTQEEELEDWQMLLTHGRERLEQCRGAVAVAVFLTSEQ